MSDLLQQREKMIEQQLKTRGIESERVISAMREVPREEFIKKELVDYAYQDGPLPIGEDQTISQPYVVALMAEALQIGTIDKVLDIGTGSGYAAAVMSKLASEVYTVEYHKRLAQSASERFKRLGYDNIYVLHGDGTKGWPEHAPYDAINVAASGNEVPQALKDQLADDGFLIIPVGENPRTQHLVRLHLVKGEIKKERLGRVQFVPLIGMPGNPPHKNMRTGKV